MDGWTELCIDATFNLLWPHNVTHPTCPSSSTWPNSSLCFRNFSRTVPLFCISPQGLRVSDCMVACSCCCPWLPPVAALSCFCFFSSVGTTKDGWDMRSIPPLLSWLAAMKTPERPAGQLEVLGQPDSNDTGRDGMGERAMPALGGPGSATISALSDFSRQLPRSQSLSPGGWMCALVPPSLACHPSTPNTHGTCVETWSPRLPYIASRLAHAIRFAASLAAWRSPWRAY